MKQITKKDLINLIKDKQENAKNEYRRVSNDTGFRTLEESKIRIIRQEREKAFIDAYQDLICYLDSVEIVPEIETIMPNNIGLTREDLEKLYSPKNITPYIEPKVEPLRNDRFREFERTNDDKTTTTTTVDAKEISDVVIQDYCNDTYEVFLDGNSGVLFFKRFIEKPRAKAYYNELVEWWKYWKQM